MNLIKRTLQEDILLPSIFITSREHISNFINSYNPYIILKSESEVMHINHLLFVDIKIFSKNEEILQEVVSD